MNRMGRGQKTVEKSTSACTLGVVVDSCGGIVDGVRGILLKYSSWLFSLPQTWRIGGGKDFLN